MMAVTSPGGRLRGALSLLGICLLTVSVPGQGLRADAGKTTGTMEKLIAAGGRVTLELDVQRLGQTGAGAARTRPAAIGFDLEQNSFLTIVVFNGELRGPSQGTARLIPVDVATLPASLASRDLLVEQTAWGAPFDLVVRDAATGRALFNVVTKTVFDGPLRVVIENIHLKERLPGCTPRWCIVHPNFTISDPGK